MAKQLTITLEPEVYRQLEEQAGPGRGKAARIGDLARDLIQRGLGAAGGQVQTAPRPGGPAKGKGSDGGVTAENQKTRAAEADRSKGANRSKTPANAAAEAPAPAASKARRKDLDVRQDGETPREHDALVRRMVSLQEQGLTVEQIAHQMQVEGFRTKRGGTTWNHATIRRYLADSKGK
jgi:hypothetical protein